MKKFLALLFLLPSICLADRLGSLTPNSNVALSTQSSAGTSPGGSNTNVQFSSGSTFGGDNGFQYDSSVSSVTLAGKLQAVSGVVINEGATDPFVTLNNTGSPGGGFIVNQNGNQFTRMISASNDFVVSVTTTSPTSNIFVTPRMRISTTASTKAQFRFNESNNGFDLRESSVIFNNGTKNPVIDWTVPGQLAITNSTVSVSAIRFPDGTVQVSSAPSSGGGTPGGSLILAIGTGTVSNFTNQTSSPTSNLGFNGIQFNVLGNGTTSLVSLNGSSVTLRGQNISNGVTGAIQFSDGNGGFNSDDTNFHWDNSGKKLNTPFITTPSAELVFEETGDFFGTARLRIQNRNGSGGALFENASLPLVDMGFKGNSSSQSIMRFDQGLALMNPANTTGEFQFLDQATLSTFNVPFVLGEFSVVVGGLFNGHQSTAKFGINNNVPVAMADIQTFDSTTVGEIIKGSSSQSADLLEIQNSSALPLASISAYGHHNSTGTAPILSSCGTGPGIVGDDYQGAITVGGGVVTACTMTFAHTYNVAPTCQISDNSTAITGDISTLNATTAIFSFSASLGGGLIYYHCGCSGSSCQ